MRLSNNDVSNGSVNWRDVTPENIDSDAAPDAADAAADTAGAITKNRKLYDNELDWKKQMEYGGLLLIGGGGHAVSVCEALWENMALYQTYEKIAILDLPEKVGSSILDVPIIGGDDMLGELRDEYAHAFISLGSIGDWQKRERLYALAAEHGYGSPNIIHPKAYLSRYSTYKHGLYAGMGAYVNAGCVINEMCILNTRCVVEHECEVGAYANIAPGAVLCGGVKVGAGTHIGAGSVVIQGIAVGKNTIIGAGSVVVRDIPDEVVAYGNPCRIIRNR